jgi:hypothetical protein
MSTKLTGTVALTKDFNPVTGDGANRYPNLTEIFIKPDGTEAYISDTRNGRVVKYTPGTNASAMVTANDAMTPHATYGFDGMFWNSDRTKLRFVDTSNQHGGGVNKSWEITLATGAVDALGNLALIGGGVRSSAAISFRRVDEDYATGFSYNSQTGIWRYDYATHQITQDPFWKIPRWGTYPFVRNGRIYTMMAVTNTHRNGPLVSVLADPSSRDYNRIRGEIGHALAAGSAMTTSTPADRNLFAPPDILAPVVDPDGDFIYWSDAVNNRCLCADMANGGQVTELLSGQSWTHADFDDVNNRIIAVFNNTTVKVIT